MNFYDLLTQRHTRLKTGHKNRLYVTKQKFFKKKKEFSLLKFNLSQKNKFTV